MSKIGRNDPCVCGSGKKYKKCCLVSAENVGFTYRRWRQVEAGLIPRLTKFAFDTLGPEIVEEAWMHFHDYESVEDFDPGSPMNMVFMPWFLFSWIFELKPPGCAEFSETTVAERFLIKNGKHLSSDEEMLLLSAIRCPYTLCEVVEVNPGFGMTLLDLLRRVKYEVVERSASQTLKRGEIIYCATTDVAGIRSNIGTSPYALRPTVKREVLELRKWIMDEIGSEEIATVHLREFEQDIRGLYLNRLKGMFTPPTLANTDGDPLVPQKLYFDLQSSDEAFHQLEIFAGENESELSQDITIKDGMVVRAEIPWLGGSEDAKKRLGGPVLLGLLKIDEDRLVVEVNSNERAKLIRQLIEERLGDGAKYKTTLIEPIESRAEEMWTAAAAGAGLPSSGDPQNRKGSSFISLDDAQPDLRAAMREIARQHWEAWFDLPVPALNDITPREAAKTEEGRELLESLLLLYENYQDDASDNALRADISKLRQDLGMDSTGKMV
jgi:hypothetical protein